SPRCRFTSYSSPPSPSASSSRTWCCGCRSTFCRNRSAASRIQAAAAISAREPKTGIRSLSQHASEAPPRLKAPSGTCDTHMHIYDKGFPKAPTALIDAPAGASVVDYLKVRARLGIERSVVVQPSTYGKDNRCTLAAMAALGPSARGVVVVDETVAD